MTDIVDSKILNELGIKPMRLSTKAAGEASTLDPSKTEDDVFLKAIAFCDRVIMTGKPFDVILKKSKTYELLDLPPFMLYSAVLETHETLGLADDEDILQITDLIERYRLGYEASQKPRTS